MTDPAYRLTNGSGCSRGSPDWMTPGTGTREAQALDWPSCVSSSAARVGRSRCRTTQPGPESSRWSSSPADFRTVDGTDVACSAPMLCPQPWDRTARAPGSTPPRTAGQSIGAALTAEAPVPHLPVGISNRQGPKGQGHREGRVAVVHKGPHDRPTILWRHRRHGRLVDGQTWSRHG